MTAQILDCTFRDGGYQNSWRFPLETVEAYIRSAIELRVPLIEVGFKLPHSASSFRGMPATTPWRFFHGLPRSRHTRLGFMINERDFAPADIEQLMGGFEPDSDRGDFVRVATNLENFASAMELAKILGSYTLRVFVNVMQASRYEPESLLEEISRVDVQSLEALYFADSLGAMSPKTVGKLFTFFGENAEVPLGFHGHDNRSLALANSLEALDSGATYVDGTFEGIGRGAGNTKIEDLLAELVPWPDLAAGFVEFLEAGDSVRACLPSDKRFGPSPEYALAARGDVHPSYVQDLMDQHEFSRSEVLAVISDLAGSGATRYISENLNIGADWFVGKHPGVASIELTEQIKGSTVVIVGPGQTVDVYASELQAFVEKPNLRSFGVGASAPHAKLGFDYLCVSNPVSIITGALRKIPAEVPIVAPWAQIPDIFSEGIEEVRKISVDLVLRPDELAFTFGRIVSLPNLRSSSYATAVALAYGAEEIIFAGFDGYPSGDKRNNEFASFLSKIREISAVSLFTLTETVFDLEHKPFD